jgi:hypothetical protein
MSNPDPLHAGATCAPLFASSARDGRTVAAAKTAEVRAATMKRSRRVVLTLMGSAAVGAVSMGLVPRRHCGSGNVAVPGPGGQPYCRPAYGGFGGAPHRFHGHPHGHGHGGHAHGGG